MIASLHDGREFEQTLGGVEDEDPGTVQSMFDGCSLETEQ